MDNTVGHKTAIAFLATVIMFFSSSLQGAFASNNVIIEPADLFVKKQIDGVGGIVELLDQNTKRLDGICSFDTDGKLDTNRGAVWNKIVVRYGVGNDGDSAGSISYNTAIPTALENAELEVSQNGRTVLRKSVRSLFAKGSETEAGADHAVLSSLRFFRDDEDVKINLRFPAGVNMAAAGAGTTPFIYVSIDALTTRKR